MVEKRGDTDTISNKLILKKAVAQKIKCIQEKAFISEKEVYDLVRSFFKRYTNIDYEFTSEELMKEMSRVYLSPEVQDKVKTLILKVAEMEHLTRQFSKQELNLTLEEFKKLVDELIVLHYENKGVLAKIMDFFHKSYSRQHKEIFDNSAVFQSQRSYVQMNILLDDVKRLSKKDVKTAKEKYKELLSLYDTLDEGKKKAYYAPVRELYHVLKSLG